MDVPNRNIVVDRVFAESGPFDLTTHDGCGLFIEAVARVLHQEDPNWGHLKKTAPHNLFNGHAVDSVLYRAAGQSFDIVAFSETKDAHPAWQPDVPRYSDADWFAPADVDPPPVHVDPPPPIHVEPPPPIDPPAAGTDARLLALEARVGELVAAVQMLAINLVLRLDRHYTGTIVVPYLGKGSVDLVPTPLVPTP
jgi:hypothetical protein